MKTIIFLTVAVILPVGGIIFLSRDITPRPQAVVIPLSANTDTGK